MEVARRSLPASADALANVLDSSHGVADLVGQAAVALDEEEKELWRQLRRKRDFEGRVAEKRVQLAELRDRRRGASAAVAEAEASVERLGSELAFARQQEREMEHDIAVLRESNRILQGGGEPQLGLAGPAEARPEARDVLAEERLQRESMQAQHDQIAHLRAHLERLSAEKAGLQLRQQALFDKQRSAEQDRNRLIGALQDDRSGINDLRFERIRLWEERTAMEREVAQILREVQLSGGEPAAGEWVYGGPGASSPGPGSEAGARPPVAGASGGVRGHVARDTPAAFAGGGGGPGGALGAAGAVADGGTPPRRHWTSFSEGADLGFGGGMGKAGGPGPGDDDALSGGLARPPSFTHLDAFGSAPGAGDPGEEAPGRGGRGDGGAGGVTEWSGTMRDFKASAASGGYP